MLKFGTLNKVKYREKTVITHNTILARAFDWPINEAIDGEKMESEREGSKRLYLYKANLALEVKIL